MRLFSRARLSLWNCLGTFFCGTHLFSPSWWPHANAATFFARFLLARSSSFGVGLMAKAKVHAAVAGLPQRAQRASDLGVIEPQDRHILCDP
jgi:hypothetical protein